MSICASLKHLVEHVLQITVRNVLCSLYDSTLPAFVRFAGTLHVGIQVDTAISKFCDDAKVTRSLQDSHKDLADVWNRLWKPEERLKTIVASECSLCINKNQHISLIWLNFYKKNGMVY